MRTFGETSISGSSAPPLGQRAPRQAPEWYAEQGIELRLDTKVTSVDIAKKAHRGQRSAADKALRGDFGGLFFFPCSYIGASERVSQRPKHIYS